MKAEELRIGNWVKLKYNPNLQNTKLEVQVKRIDYDHLLPPPEGEYYINGYEVRRYDPIELFPEILEKAGFKFDNNNVYWTTSPFGWIGFRNIGDLQCIMVSENKETSILTPLRHIKYTHQLQNLYFNLCGSELPLNL